MLPLDIYATIEEYLEFEEEIHELYKSIGYAVLKNEPKTLIDIGCGQGEFCHIMEMNGIKAFGVDLSSKQIQIATSKGCNVKCVDIKHISDKFDCATAIFDVINYISNVDIKEFLTNSYNLLNDDGYFVFDINSLYGFDAIAQGSLNISQKDKFIAIDANFKNNILYTDMTLFSKINDANYLRDEGTIKQYFYTNNYLSKLLKEIGFVVEEIHDLYLHSDEKADKYIFICKRIKHEK